MPVRVGIQIQPQHIDFHSMLDGFREAEELGVDAIYTWDHFYPLYGEPDGKHWEGLTTLTALASVTSKVKVGALVFCNSYRNPQLLADAHRTIDQLSNGRVIFGIGAGWFERDYDEYGYEFGTAPDRLRALSRDLPLMKERLTKLNPGPVQSELPFLIGGAGEKVTLKLVAQYAQLWHTFADVDTYRQKTAILEQHCAKVGRDPATIEHVIGTRGNILEEATGLADAGVAELTAHVGGVDGGYDFGELRELLAWRDEYNAAH